jgi:hypothetical protein
MLCVPARHSLELSSNFTEHVDGCDTIDGGSRFRVSGQHLGGKREPTMSQKKAIDATAAEAAVRRMLEGQYGGKIRSLTFDKVWYTAAATREFWEVQGVLIYRKGVFGKERRNFRYQVDPDSGEVMGYEETTVR